MRGVRPIGRDQHRGGRLPPRDSPDDMDGIPAAIPLQHESTWPLEVVRLVLNDSGGHSPLDRLPGKDTIFRHLIVPMY